MKRFGFLSLFLIMGFSAFTQNIRMIDEIKSFDNGSAVWWIGQDSWIIKSNGLVIATDLYLGGQRITPSPITPEELAEIVDLYFVTHAHGDHFGRKTAGIMQKNSNCRFILPESCLKAAEELNIPSERITVARPREPFEVNGIHVDPLRAIHGNKNFAIYYDANLEDCGYMIKMNGISFLQPGDSYLLEDHLFLKNVDVLFFSPTEHNMHIKASVILINELNPRYIFPQHHSTMLVNDENRFWTKGYPDEVKILLNKSVKEKYHILKPGDMMVIK